jgi:hypothetical protein
VQRFQLVNCALWGKGGDQIGQNAVFRAAVRGVLAREGFQPVQLGSASAARKIEIAIF